MISIINKRKLTILVVYAAGFFTGMALIMFPAAGNIFKDPELYALSNTQYGALFIPMILLAIFSSSLSAGISRTKGTKTILLLGLIAIVISMAILSTSYAFLGTGNLPYILLLFAIASIGGGFGFTLSALNAYAFDLFQKRADSAVTALHAFLGIGQAGAPIALALFLSLGGWWWVPLAVIAALIILLVLSVSLPMQLSSEEQRRASHVFRRHLPRRIWVFGTLALLYGISEATFGNWSPIFLHEEKGLSLAEASLALSVFWGMVTFGRVGLSVIALWMKTKILYVISPVLIGIAFLTIPLLNGVFLNILGLALAGIACSYFFPLTISFASAEAPESASATSGLMVSSIMIGTGIGTFSVGAIRNSLDMPLSLIFMLSSFYVLITIGIAFYLVLLSKGGDRVEKS